MVLENNRASEIVAALRNDNFTCPECIRREECGGEPGCLWRHDAAALIEQLTAELPNDPLTLEELRGMDGDPVWVEFIGRPDGSLIPPIWMLVNVGMKRLVTDTKYIDWSDEGWLAYRRKPNGGGEI